MVKPEIDKKTLKDLSKRILRLETYYYIFLSYQVWDFISLFLVMVLCFIYQYCTVWGGADAIWHECGHHAFKTRIKMIFFTT